MGDVLQAVRMTVVHAANILLGADDTLYVVDWDTLCLAPKERDLMFIGAGIGGGWRTEREAAAFYRGYGPAAVDAEAIAYYRYERIVQDIAVGGEQLLGTQAGGANRAEELEILVSQFRPGSVVDIAFASDPQPPA
jgi:spectinomycin phosphotransferase